MLASLGFKRLILERQLSLEEIRAIREAVPGCELEFFVHGAICVSYSGNCYLSQYLTGRSANRGACIQACRSLYDVVDGDGNTLARNRSILSPKDYCLDNRLEELADAGICSFKIEGRLKGDDYVKNLCRHYRSRIDEICSRRTEYVPASSGMLEGGFSPNPPATFNRGYTEFYIDGRRSRWNSKESTKSIGEYIGRVVEVQNGGNAGRSRFAAGSKVTGSQRDACQHQSPRPRQIIIEAGRPLFSGDGLVFVGDRGLIGMRADVVEGDRVTVKGTEGISAGDRVYRNYNIRFSKELQNNMPRRKIDVEVVFGHQTVTATDADGFCVSLPLPEDAPLAEKQDAAIDNIRRNMGKRTGHFDFSCTAVEQSPAKFYPAATLNALRRELAAELERMRVETLRPGSSSPEQSLLRARENIDPLFPTQSCSSLGEPGRYSSFRQALLSGGTCLQKLPLASLTSSLPTHSASSAEADNLPASGPSRFTRPRAVMVSLRQVPTYDFAPGIVDASGEDTNRFRAADYRANCANHLAREVLKDLGFERVDDAYELKPVPDAELMRSRYCVKYELGLCPKLHPAKKVKEPLALVNAGRKLKLSFDCKRCEMIVSLFDYAL